MYTTPPVASSPAEKAPASGHGLGSTRWYGCFGPCPEAGAEAACAPAASAGTSAMSRILVLLRFVPSVDGRPARGGGTAGSAGTMSIADSAGIMGTAGRSFRRRDGALGIPVIGLDGEAGARLRLEQRVGQGDGI